MKQHLIIIPDATSHVRDDVVTDVQHVTSPRENVDLHVAVDALQDLLDGLLSVAAGR